MAELAQVSHMNHSHPARRVIRHGTAAETTAREPEPILEPEFEFEIESKRMPPLSDGAGAAQDIASIDVASSETGSGAWDRCCGAVFRRGEAK